MSEPKDVSKSKESLMDLKTSTVNEALIRTMPERYIGAAVGKAPVVREIVETRTVTPPPPPKPPVVKPPAKKSKKRLIIILGAVFVLLIGIGVAAYILLSPAPKVPAPVVNTNKPVNTNTNKNINTTPPPPSPICGNGIVENGETCDIGTQNGVTDSGCNASCQTVSKLPPPPPNTGTDSDSDGLTDIEETTVYGTDAHKLDTDGDSFNDGNEVSHLYDPMAKSPAMLNKAKSMTVEKNISQGYEVIVPSRWNVSGSDTTQFMSVSSTGESFNVLVVEKPQEQPLVEWYLAMSPGTVRNDVERFKTIGGYDALRSPDRLTTYIDPGNGKIFTLTYSFDDQTKLEFRTTYEAFVGGFVLAKQ